MFNVFFIFYFLHTWCFPRSGMVTNARRALLLFRKENERISDCWSSEGVFLKWQQTLREKWEMIPIVLQRDINYAKILISGGLVCNLRALQGSFCSGNGGTLCKRSVADCSEAILRIFSPLTPPFQKHVTYSVWTGQIQFRMSHNVLVPHHS